MYSFLIKLSILNAFSIIITFCIIALLKITVLTFQASEIKEKISFFSTQSKTTNELIQKINRFNTSDDSWELASYYLVNSFQNPVDYNASNIRRLYIDMFQHHIRVNPNDRWKNIHLSITTQRYNILLIIVYILSFIILYRYTMSMDLGFDPKEGEES